MGTTLDHPGFGGIGHFFPFLKDAEVMTSIRRAYVVYITYKREPVPVLMLREFDRPKPVILTIASYSILARSIYLLFLFLLISPELYSATARGRTGTAAKLVGSAPMGKTS